MLETHNEETTKVILLSGLSGSGKDTIARLLMEKTGMDWLSFADPLHLTVSSLFNYDLTDWRELYDDHKNEPQAKLLGKTPRQVLNMIAESWVKPSLGNNFFAKSVIDHANEDPWASNIMVVSDLGFKEELDKMVEEYGKENILVATIVRENTGHEDDTRTVLTGEKEGVHTITIENNETPVKATNTLIKKMTELEWVSYE